MSFAVVFLPPGALRPAERAGPQALPLFTFTVPAGFPSPAEDHLDSELDLNEYLIQHKSATFYVRVKGDSMCGAGILNGDLLVVDRAVKASSGRIVVAVVDGSFTVKRLILRNGQAELVSENKNHPAMLLGDDQELQVWGVVVGVVRKVQQ